MLCVNRRHGCPQFLYGVSFLDTVLRWLTAAWGAYLASMTTSFSSRRLRSFEHTWLLAGLPDSASFWLQVKSLVRERRARKSRDIFFALSDLRGGPVLRDSSLSSFLFFAGLVIGTISCFTRSLFSDDVGFAVDHVLGMLSSAPALTSVDLFSLSLLLSLTSFGFLRGLGGC